jgi:hypothetical protein
MDLASSVLCDNPVHEVEKFKPSPPLVLTPRHLARRNVESGEERNNWSVGLDIIILIRTCFEVLREGGY